jgi:hypothetical protein
MAESIKGGFPSDPWQGTSGWTSSGGQWFPTEDTAGPTKMAVALRFKTDEGIIIINVRSSKARENPELIRVFDDLRATFPDDTLVDGLKGPQHQKLQEIFGKYLIPDGADFRFPLVPFGAVVDLTKPREEQTSPPGRQG